MPPPLQLSEELRQIENEKPLDRVASCGHTRPMKRKKFRYGLPSAEPLVLKEVASALEEQELVVNVRAAKDQLSSLLEQAANGNVVVITSDGQPKARLVPIRPRRQPFRVDWGLLRSMPLQSGVQTTEELVREDRDGRG